MSWDAYASVCLAFKQLSKWDIYFIHLRAAAFVDLFQLQSWKTKRWLVRLKIELDGRL